MNTYIVVQAQIDSDKIVNNERNIIISNVIRQVKAETMEIAIGKFVLATQDIQAIKKLNIECYDLSNLKSI